MNDLTPIRWKEGMFLRPQHFQQHDVFLAARENARLAALEPQGWGIVRLQVDQGALDAGSFEVQALTAVFPDGVLLDAPANSGPLTRKFAPQMVEVGKGLSISVGIRQTARRVAQTEHEGAAGPPARYTVEQREVEDLETGLEPHAIEFLNLQPRLFLGSEPADGYDVLPLSRLVGTGNPSLPVALDPTFAPPTVRLSACSALHGAVRTVIERLVTVLRLAGEVKSGMPDAAQLLLIQTLGGALPVLRDIAQSGICHPRSAHRELARLAGMLMYRDEQGRGADAIPFYDHVDPAPAFFRLRDLIRELTEIDFARRWLRLPMERADDLYHVTLPREARLPGARLVLHVAAVESEPLVRNLMLGAKISTPERIAATLTRFALPGIPTEALTSPPPELPGGQGGAFFRLKLEDSTEWQQHVVAGEQFGAMLLRAPSDIRLSLIVLLPSA